MAGETTWVDREGADRAGPGSSLRSLLGKRTADPLDKVGLVTAGDLLGWYPRAYLEAKLSTTQLREGEHLVVVAEVLRAAVAPIRSNPRKKLLRATVTDGTTEIDLTFFSHWGPAKDLTPGTLAVFSGKAGTFNGRWQLSHPDYQVIQDSVRHQQILPVYRAVDKLTSWQIGTAMGIVLDAVGDLEDPVPDELLRRHGLCDRTTAIRLIHQPGAWGDLETARARLRYDEALVLQTALVQRRLTAAADEGTARPGRPGGLLDAFDAALPFPLTEGQRIVGEELAHDLASPIPMHRLLQGDVGSGKTVVALRAMLQVVDSGGQAALLAPTEVLAAQHDRSIRAIMGPLAEAGLLGGADDATRVVLLTGSMSTDARRRALSEAASGQAGIVIGTHALIQEAVQLADLGLVVVDEQHRFGVEQRDALRAKAARPPHVLVMTATPIPRSVAMTVFGDMETAVLRELPAGRSPITTHVVRQGDGTWMARMWQVVADAVAAGRQAYVVCGRIGDSDSPSGDETEDGFVEVGPSAGAGAASGPDGPDGAGGPGGIDDPGGTDDDATPRPPAVSLLQAYDLLLHATPQLQGVRFALLHGRLSGEEKDATMRRFAAGEIDVLVATTVIEVGVDVPNATVMVVLDADRFGISQLHQLRGRVGRGQHAGTCFLATPVDPSGEPEGQPVAWQRLQAVAGTTDGFALAEQDLELRGEGDVLGASQSGRRRRIRMLRLANPRDVELIAEARDDAQALLSDDVALTAHPRLATWLADTLDDESAAYLERG
ncbi:ATP-dependent DNA helicase RecG [Arsenicicoccus bolidensis]|uniref:ATP-dependent DNA helicase RecG n=1 Tax=Arsenicicoccus bolidensis TaxID=229480 RepID=UPI0004129DC7|nr:ATP-dependent DNA helicase RecG [Arsenicicoccus bolidensis]